MLYYLGNNGKDKVYVFGTDAIVFLEFSLNEPLLVESLDGEPLDTEG